MSSTWKWFANIVLTATLVLIGLLLSEIGYRAYFEWRDAVRWRKPRPFWASSTSVWQFDANLGYRYPAYAQMDAALISNGTVRLCEAFVTGADGSPGKGIDPTKAFDARYLVLGDSFTARVHQDQTWPDILSDLLAQSGRSASVMNLARGGYGVLQMFDQAAELVQAGHRPDAILIAIIGPDLVRARTWRLTREDNGTVEVFTSTIPSLEVRPETHIRSAFISRNVSRRWCDDTLASGRTEETTKLIEMDFAAVRRKDETIYRRPVRLFSLSDCYLCDRLFSSTRRHTLVNTNPSHDLTRFQDDHRFVENLIAIRGAAIPIWLVYLPWEPELKSGHKKLTAQEQSLLYSLVMAVDRLIDLTPATPMGDSARAMTLLPEDSHPSRAGLEYYAAQLRRVMVDQQ
jgi:hypothetical protein